MIHGNHGGPPRLPQPHLVRKLIDAARRRSQKPLTWDEEFYLYRRTRNVAKLLDLGDRYLRVWGDKVRSLECYHAALEIAQDTGPVFRRILQLVD